MIIEIIKVNTFSMNILLIGGGNMGSTYAKCFLRSHICNEEAMMILERSEEKAAVLATQNIGTVYSHPAECVPRADLIIFAVKPQDFSALAESISPYIHAQQVYLSIMAGVKINNIRENLNIQKIIRAMPNLPAQIGMGMTAFTSTDEVTRLELVMVQNLLNTTGKTIYVEKEQSIDAATAISGSGPAYVFFFMNAMMEAAIKMGFSQSEAELLTSQTFKGAVDLYIKANFSFDEWIQKVASKGGTTEAALRSFQDTALHKSIQDGAEAALQRAIELGLKN